MNEFLKIIQERHSARVAFDPNHQIAKRNLEQILEAARWTPTAHNMQNFEIVVDDKKQLEAIGKIRSQVSDTFLRENYQQTFFLVFMAAPLLGLGRNHKVHSPRKL